MMIPRRHQRRRGVQRLPSLIDTLLADEGQILGSILDLDFHDVAGGFFGDRLLEGEAAVIEAATIRNGTGGQVAGAPFGRQGFG